MVQRDGPGGSSARPQPAAKTRVSVSFDFADYEELQKIATEKRVSVAWVVRDAVAAYIFRRGPSSGSRRTAGPPRGVRNDGVRSDSAPSRGGCQVLPSLGPRMDAMTITTLLFALLAACLVGATFYFAGLRAGERHGRHQTRSDLDAIARAAAEESNQHAREAYEHATGQAVERLQAAARSDRELGEAKFNETAGPLRESLTKVEGLARELEQKRAEDHGALQKVAERLSSQVENVQDSSRSLREALKGDRQAAAAGARSSSRT